MTNLADITLDNNHLQVTGVLHYANVMSVLHKSMDLLPSLNQITIDLSGVTAANSAAVGLLVEWIKYAKKVNKPIQFSGLSDHLISLIKAAHLDVVIPI